MGAIFDYMAGKTTVNPYSTPSFLQSNYGVQTGPQQPQIPQFLQPNYGVKIPSQILGTSTQNNTAPSLNTGGGSPAPSAPGTSSAPNGPSEQEILQKQLDQIFSPVFSSLQGQEQTLGANQVGALNDINSQYGASAASLGQQKTEGMAGLATQEQQAGTRKEDALSSATRLYNELQRGGQQRFGGASSAGEAFQSLTAQEQQRRQGDIQGAYESAMQQVGQFKATLQDKFAVSMKELEAQKNSTINDVQSQFRDALQQIRSATNQAQSDKATASMNLLQDLRNKVFTINQQIISFAQQLAANHEMSLKSVDAYTQQVMQSLSGGQNVVNSLNTQLSTNYGNTGQQQQTATPQYTGAIANNKKYYQFGNEIA